MQLSQPGGHAEAHHRLSAREMEVFLRLISGLRPTDVARVLNMSVKTVSTHKTRIMEKLQLPNTAALIRYGLEHGLVGDTLALKASTQAQADEPLKDAGGGMEPSCPL
jgi:DNA-binding CsgD family transcriptional regulator